MNGMQNCQLNINMQSQKSDENTIKGMDTHGQGADILLSCPDATGSAPRQGRPRSREQLSTKCLTGRVHSYLVTEAVIKFLQATDCVNSAASCINTVYFSYDGCILDVLFIMFYDIFFP